MAFTRGTGCLIILLFLVIYQGIRFIIREMSMCFCNKVLEIYLESYLFRLCMLIRHAMIKP